MAKGDVICDWECQWCGATVFVRETTQGTLMYSCTTIEDGQRCSVSFGNALGSSKLRERLEPEQKDSHDEISEEQPSEAEAVENAAIEAEPEAQAAEEDRQSEPGEGEKSGPGGEEIPPAKPARKSARKRPSGIIAQQQAERDAARAKRK